MNQLASLPNVSALADDAEHIAEERIFSDLINTLLAERFLDDQLVDWLAPEVLGRLLSLPDGPFWEWPEGTRCLRWWVDRDAKQTIVFTVKKAIVQPYRYVPSGGVFSVRFLASGDIAEPWHKLTPVELLQHVIAICLNEHQRQQKGVANVLDLLATTQWQLSQSIAGSTTERNLPGLSTAQCFQALERRAALRDRPFHPVAKAKQGLDEANHEHYAAEFDRPMTLRWIAMDRRQLMLGTQAAAGEMLHEPLDLILTAAERQTIEAEMASLGLARSTHLAMPVHPWQMAYGLPEHLSEMLAKGDGIPLETAGGVFQATSSLRSLAPVGDGRHYLKLPMAVFSLGAARYLPAVKLINGERGQTMLEQAKPLDPVLQAQLYLCNERQWWSYMPEGNGLFDDPPRHLGAMVREYPATLLEDQCVCLLPMAALGVPLSRDDGHFFDDWLRYRQLPEKADAIEGLFGEVCSGFFDIVLRLYRLGLMPEIHGQNAVLVWRDGHIDGLLLRDHDSVRLHQPWLDRNGIDDPDYQIRPGYSNSLYNDSPRDLLFYLQTLGIQVNLYAIIETLALHYDVEEASLWRVLRECLEDRIAQLPFTAEERKTLQVVLFDDVRWPLKCVLRPLLEQQGVPGSMPSGKSTLPNPFRSEAFLSA